MHAQVAGELVRQGAMLNQKAVTRALQQRANTSYKKALAALKKQENDLLTREYPVQIPFIEWEELPFQAKDLYPDVPFLLNNKQAELYLQHRINREISKDVSANNKWYHQLRKHLEDFELAQVQITHSPTEDVNWLARQIPPQTSYLLLGEYHLLPDAPSVISTLLKTLREQQPARPIFLFTEQMYHKTHTVINPFYEELFAQLEADTDLHIQVVGLEMETVGDYAWVTGRNETYINTTDLWATREGIRLRNTYWLNILKKYRAENPEALFIVHGGLGHIGYTYPYSIGSTWSGPNTFVISLTPEKERTPFDLLTKKRFLNERVLQFNDKALSRLAGFDVQLRLPSAPLMPPSGFHFPFPEE